MIWIILALIIIVIAIVTVILEKDENGLSLIITGIIFTVLITLALIGISTGISLSATKASTVDTFTKENVVEIMEGAKKTTVKLENENIYSVYGLIEVKEGYTYTVKKKNPPLWVSIAFTCFWDKNIAEDEIAIIASYNPNEL